MFARRNSSIVVLLLAALLLAAKLISQEVLAQTPAKPADRISGMVINSVTNEPIARALVVSEGERFATLTDGGGRFELVFADASAGGEAATGPGHPTASRPTSVDSRPYMLMARKPGFLNRQNEQGQSGERVVEGKDVEIALVPEALIVGHVALPTSEPPDPIEVELYRREVRKGRAHWVSVKVQSTRSDGEFRFAELPAGTYKLLSHELRDEDPKFAVPGGQVYGYAPVYYPNANGFSSAGTIELTPGRTAQVNLSLVREPYFPVIVPVTNVPSGRFFGLDVSVQGPGGPGYALEYDSQKQSIIGLLPNGTYRLQAVTFGEQALSGEANITVHGGAEGTVMALAVTPPIRVNVKDQFSSNASSVTITTIDAKGKRISQQRRFGLTVTLEPVDNFGPQQQNGSPQGSLDSQTDSLKIEHVAPGRYWVEAYPTNGYVASVTAGSVDLQYHPLVVPSGSSVPSIEVTLRDDSATIEGAVEGTSGLTGPAAPILHGPYGWSGPSSSDSSARVYFIPSPGSTGRFTEQSVSHDGKFSVMLPPGEYRVLVFPQVQPDLEYENPDAMRPYDGKGQVVRLAAGQKERMQLQLVSTNE